MRRRRRGFTLIEVIIVVIIVGILAAVSGPIMQGFKTRAIVMEAQATINIIRTSLQFYYTRNHHYPARNEWLVSLSSANFTASFPGLNSVDDLQGVFFGKECYSVTAWDSVDHYIVYAYTNPPFAGGVTNTAVRSAETAAIADIGHGTGIIIWDSDKDHFTQTYVTASGLPAN